MVFALLGHSAIIVRILGALLVVVVLLGLPLRRLACPDIMPEDVVSNMKSLF